MASTIEYSFVVPAKAGTQGQRTSLVLDSRLRGNDEKNLEVGATPDDPSQGPKVTP
jgi:hypothetical protein